MLPEDGWLDFNDEWIPPSGDVTTRFTCFSSALLLFLLSVGFTDDDDDDDNTGLPHDALELVMLRVWFAIELICIGFLEFCVWSLW